MQLGWGTFLFVVLLLAMLVMSYPLLFRPLNEERDRALEITANKQQKLNALAAKAAENQSSPEDIQKLQDAIKLLETRLPKATEMDKVLQDVWEAARVNKLVVKSVRNA